MEKRLDDHRNRLTAGESRFLRIETDLGRLPTNDAISRLELAMTKLAGELAVANKRLDGYEHIQDIVKNQVDRIDGWLRDK